MAKGFLAEVGCSLLSHGGKHHDLCYIFRRDEIWVKYCTYAGAMSALGIGGHFAAPLTPYPSTHAIPGTFSETRLYRPERETGSAAWGINMWTRRGHPSTTADMVLSWGEILYRASVMLAGLIIVFGAINCLYQVSILEEPIIPVVPFVLAAAIWLVGFFCRQISA